jgi:hypothetical protein
LLFKNIKIKICISILLPDVSLGCETWSLPLKEERRLRVSENRVLRRIFAFKRDEITRKLLYIVEFKDLYSSPNIIRVIKSRRTRWVRHVARRERCKQKGLGGETSGK